MTGPRFRLDGTPPPINGEAALVSLRRSAADARRVDERPLLVSHHSFTEHLNHSFPARRTKMTPDASRSARGSRGVLAVAPKPSEPCPGRLAREIASIAATF